MLEFILAFFWFCILSTWPYYLSCSNFVNFTVSLLYSMSFIFLFVLILQHFPTFMSPYIFLTIFHSDILIEFILTMCRISYQTFSFQSSIQIFWSNSYRPCAGYRTKHFPCNLPFRYSDRIHIDHMQDVVPNISLPIFHSDILIEFILTMCRISYQTFPLQSSIQIFRSNAYRPCAGYHTRHFPLQSSIQIFWSNSYQPCAGYRTRHFPCNLPFRYSDRIHIDHVQDIVPDIFQHTNFWDWKPEFSCCREVRDVDETVILNWVSKKYSARCRLGWTGSDWVHW